MLKLKKLLLSPARKKHRSLAIAGALGAGAAISAALFGLPADATAAIFGKEEFSLRTLADMYENVSHGAIRLSQEGLARLESEGFSAEGLEFHKRDVPMTEFQEKAERARMDLLQDVFELDVASFVSATGSQDFLEAKEKFYSQRTYDTDRQLYTRPYPFLAQWGSLFHPPVKAIQGQNALHVKEFGSRENLPVNSAFRDPVFQADLDQIAKSELTFGNELTHLAGEISFKEKVRMARETKESLWISLLVISCEKSNHELIDTLETLAKEGKDVRLMLDGLFRLTVTGPCVNRLKRAGVQVRTSNHAFDPATLTSVMHQKIWIRDGEEMIIGGQNVMDYQNLDNGYNFLMHDTDVKVKGPVITDVMVSYLDQWVDLSGKTRNRIKETYKRDRDLLERLILKRQSQREALVRGKDSYATQLAGTPKGACRAIFQTVDQHNHAPVLAEYVKRAQSHVWFTTPNVTMDPQYVLDGKTRQDDSAESGLNKVMGLLRERSKKEGLRVDTVTNGMEGGDGWVVVLFRRERDKAIERGDTVMANFWDNLWRGKTAPAASNRASLLPLIKDNAAWKAWTYFTYFHAKQWYFDRQVLYVGSYNMDIYSNDRSYEAGVICEDETFNQQFENHMTKILSNSIPMLAVEEESKKVRRMEQHELRKKERRAEQE